MARASRAMSLAVAAIGFVGCVGGARAYEVVYVEIAGGTVTITATDITSTNVTTAFSNNTV